MRGAAAKDDDGAITFLYTLGEGGCPKSFGINVARLARLPQAVVVSARQASSDFELDIKKRMSNAHAGKKEQLVIEAIKNGNWNELLNLQSE
jgi:DNA mismatch repair ATPase MutS